jgi:hypothetical protein
MPARSSTLIGTSAIGYRVTMGHGSMLTRPIPDYRAGSESCKSSPLGRIPESRIAKNLPLRHPGTQIQKGGDST